ncbi:MAG: hypothetical protein RL131_265 [Bacteroidota bacterium]|jgi:glutathione peroxidase
MSRIGKRILLFSLLILVGMVWACVSSKNNTQMTTRQGILKSVYPVLTGITKLLGVNNRVLVPEGEISPNRSIYDLSYESIDGDTVSLSQYKGKKIIIVNTASDCGYTAQYEELQQLYDLKKSEVVILGFPANDFKNQEKGSNEQISNFCKKNYGVSFPLASKVVVVKGAQQHPVFQWLSDPTQNGWNAEAPAWNFSKYVLDEEGRLIGYADPAVKPLAKSFTQILNISIP